MDKYLSENDNYFIKKINILRNHFVHGNDLPESYTDVDITIFARQLNLFVYAFILLEIDVPNTLISEKIKSLLPINDKNKYIQVCSFI
ncbi:HEPN domain-containing protein [Fructilactobacillus sanfranciscensis]|uniref:HEPN domain-containing protein n=2 Tax=Fructilactobacillus sanfranciscensis TaxID=1625 RepID=UPI003B981360